MGSREASAVGLELPLTPLLLATVPIKIPTVRVSRMIKVESHRWALIRAEKAAKREFIRNVPPGHCANYHYKCGNATKVAGTWLDAQHAIFVTPGLGLGCAFFPVACPKVPACRGWPVAYGPNSSFCKGPFRPGYVSKKLRNQDARQDQQRSGAGAPSQTLIQHHKGCEPGKDRLQSEDESGMSGWSKLLRPSLHRKCDSRSQNAGHQNSCDHCGRELQVRLLKHRAGNGGQQGGGGHLEDRHLVKRKALAGPADEDDLKREPHGAGNGEQVTPIHIGKVRNSLPPGWNGHEEKPDKGSNNAHSTPGIDVRLPDEDQQQRNLDCGDAGEECRLGWRGQAQAGGLEGVSEEQENPSIHACPEGRAGDPGKMPAIKERQQNCRQ